MHVPGESDWRELKAAEADRLFAQVGVALEVAAEAAEALIEEHGFAVPGFQHVRGGLVAEVRPWREEDDPFLRGGDGS